MILLELFSGIGGFAKGFQQAGYKFTKHYFSEVDKHAIANYKHNFPNAESIGSVTDVSGSQIERPDIITFGFPCQDHSIAGKRKGFDGKRSVLFYEAMRIIEETKPDIFIFENVKGLFSSNSGKDFTAVLRTIADLRLYECEWELCNTKWLLPQNRERIYFIGHLAGRSKPGVFPFGENDFTINPDRSRQDTQSQTKLAATINGVEKDRADGNFVIVGNLKGESGHNVNNVYSENGIAPAVRENHGKVTPVFITEPQHKHGDERIYTDCFPTVQSRYGTGGDNVPYVNSIRRLTEIECERLQGFSEIENKFTINIWDNYSEYQKNFASAESKNPKLQKSVGNAGKTGLKQNVSFVGTKLNPNDLSTNKPVQEIVHINYEEGKLEILNQEKLSLFVNSVVSKDYKVHQIHIENFVLQLVRINSIVERIIQDGKEGLLLNEQLLIHQENGKNVLNLFGRETMQPVKNAKEDSTTKAERFKDITSNHFDSKNQEQTLITSCYYVSNAIDGFIQKRIQAKNLSLTVSLKYGWTQYGNYDGVIKKIAKTQRYKLLGNAVTVNIVQMIAERLKPI